MALLSLEADDCRGCGQPRSETMATTIDERGHKRPAHFYEAKAWICAACQAKEQHMRDFEDHAGLYFTVTKTR